MAECQRCWGDYSDYDPCYACGNSGVVAEHVESYNDWVLRRLSEVASELAHRQVDAQVEAMDESEDSEPLYFHAAENMMTAYEYKLVMLDGHTMPIIVSLARLALAYYIRCWPCCLSHSQPSQRYHVPRAALPWRPGLLCY